MAKFDKVAVLAKMAEAPIVPVFYHKDAEVAKQVVKACYEGGIRAFEFTNRGDFAHELAANNQAKVAHLDGVIGSRDNNCAIRFQDA